MSTQNLVTHKKMLAIIMGVAIFATAGMSTAFAQTAGSTGQTSTLPPQIQGSINVEQLLLSNVKISFSDAATTAATDVSNGKVIGGSLIEAQGYLVYVFEVIDDKNMVYSVMSIPQVERFSTHHQVTHFKWGLWHEPSRSNEVWTPHGGKRMVFTKCSIRETTTPSDLITPSGLQ
jgi:uncharacterized membrane protein YkoI